MWASRVLGRRERQRFGSLRLPEERQLEWLGARTAAKEAIAELLAPHGLDLLQAEIEILPGDDGAPIVDAPGLERLEVAPVVSLAHAKGQAVAIAALRGDERRLLERVPGELGEEWLLRCWCAKEAVGKAAGSGLAPGRPEAPALVSVDRDGQQLILDVGERRFVVHTRRDGDLIVATTVSTPQSGSGQR